MEVVKNIIKKIISNNILIYALFILTTEILFKVLANTFSIDFSLLRIAISSFIFSVMLNLIKPKKTKKIVMIIVAVIISIYSLLQLGFNNFLGGYISVNTSSQLGKVTEYIKDYILSFKLIYYTILIPLIIIIIYIIRNKNLIDTLNKKTLIIMPVLIALYILTLTLGFMENKYQYLSNIELFKKPSIPSIAVNQFGCTIYGILDINSKIFDIENTDALQIEVNEQPKEEVKEDTDLQVLQQLIETEKDKNYKALNKYFYSKENEDKNAYTGKFEGKNLILVLLESVNELMINEEYFPTLYKMYNEGITFTNNYSPRTSCSTGNNEFSTLTSLYAINSKCTGNIYRNNVYTNSIFNLFNNKDYDTYSFHDFDDKYYLRSKYLVNMGSSVYKNAKDLKISYSSLYREWPSDVELIEKSFPIFSSSEKYMTYLVTVSAHQPYNVPSTLSEKNASLFKNVKNSNSIKRYYSKLKEVDLAMEELLKTLEKNGTLDDTVIVLFGDHYPYGLNTKDLQKEFDYDITLNKEIERTPFIIYNSATEPTKIEKNTTYMNILPTIANLFNLEYSSRFFVGGDALDEDYDGIAVFPDGSWQSPYAYYDAETSKISYLNDTYKYTDEEINTINKRINQDIKMSNLAITKNYFKYFNEEKEKYLNSINDDDKKGSN